MPGQDPPTFLNDTFKQAPDERVRRKLEMPAGIDIGGTLTKNLWLNFPVL